MVQESYFWDGEVESLKYNGDAYDIAWGAASIGDGKTAAGFDGTNSFIDIHTPLFEEAFSGNRFSILINLYNTNWVGAFSDALRLEADANNKIVIQQDNLGNFKSFFQTATATNQIVSGLAPNTWYTIVVTVDTVADEFNTYINGVLTGGTQSGLGTFAGDLAIALIGATTAAPTGQWGGRIAHVAYWNDILTAAEIADKSVIDATYFTRVFNTQNDDLVVYFQLDESEGATALDYRHTIATGLTGDATLAPFTGSDIARTINATSVLGSLLDSFVIPTIYSDGTPGDELEVVDSANLGKITVQPGEAVVKGALYVNDADLELTIPATPDANPAIHRIVLQKDSITQEVRANVIQGTSAVTPSAPNIPSNGASLAWVYVTGAYNPAADLVSTLDIHDERVFMQPGPITNPTASGGTIVNPVNKNLVPNSEFFAWSRGANNPPDKWVLVNTPTITSNTVLGATWLSRGRLVRIQDINAGEGMSITFPVTNTETYIHTFVFYADVTAGQAKVTVRGVNLDTGATGATKIIEINPAANIDEYIIRNQIIPDQFNAFQIIVETNTAAFNDDFDIGNFICTNSYTASRQRQTHETIMLDQALTDAGWTASAKATGAYTINLAGSFGSTILPYIRGVIATIACSCATSGGSAIANDATLRVFHNGQAVPADQFSSAVSCARIANNSVRHRTVYIPIDQSDANAPFKVYAQGVGATDLDVTIEITGIVT